MRCLCRDGLKNLLAALPPPSSAEPVPDRGNGSVSDRPVCERSTQRSARMHREIAVQVEPEKDLSSNRICNRFHVCPLMNGVEREKGPRRRHRWGDRNPYRCQENEESIVLHTLTMFAKPAIAKSRFSFKGSRMREHKFARLLVLILALGVVLVSSRPGFAARHVPIAVSIGGKVVIKSGGWDNGRADADTVWRYLKDLKLQPMSGFGVEPDREDPLRATLKGDVVIDVRYGGRAEITELNLIRANEDVPWQIAPAEVERTLRSRHKPFVFTLLNKDKPAPLWTVQRTRTGETADDPENVWRVLKRLTIYGRKIAPDGDDPLRATLTGGVIIELSYAGQSWGRAEVLDLKLVRDSVNTLWRVDPTEVDRTFKSRTMIPAGAGNAENTSNREASSRVSGTWKWSVGRAVMTLRLKQENDKLTGALIADNGPETVIEDGTYSDAAIFFKVSRQVGNAKATAEYAGKVNGNTIEGGMRAYIGARPKALPRPAFWQATRSGE